MVTLKVFFTKILHQWGGVGMSARRVAAAQLWEGNSPSRCSTYIWDHETIPLALLEPGGL